MKTPASSRPSASADVRRRELSLKKRLLLCFFIVLILVLAGAAPAAMMLWTGPFRDSFVLSRQYCLLSILFDLCALIIVFFLILRPVLQVNKMAANVLAADHLTRRTRFSDDDLGRNTLLLQFQELMDREHSYTILYKQAELDALQSQINPHFLYNTLDSIRGAAVLRGEDDIADMAKALSEFFRYNIDRTEQTVPLQEEFRNIKTYIQIQNYRFNNKYHLRFFPSSPGADLLRLQIPRLTLQPLVENALLHGVRNSLNPSETIDIETTLTDCRLIISVVDHGVGIDEKKLEQINRQLKGAAPDARASAGIGSRDAGIALSNINDRIRLLFGSQYGLHVMSTKGEGTTIKILLPKRLNETAPDSAGRPNEP